MSSLKHSTLGIIGLGVMGRSLCLNFVNHNYIVSIYDIDEKKVNDLHRESPDNIHKCKSLLELVESVSKPHIIFMMVPAGSIIDTIIENVSPFLIDGDILIDGGNSHYKTTNLRYEKLLKLGINFLGVGISGGERGALIGPSMMVGGSFNTWNIVKPLLTNISAKYKSTPCCEYMGPKGSGHFVKMVHNGIEYAIMQLISEIYDIYRKVYNYKPEEISKIFDSWKDSELNSYLIHITSVILKKKEKGKYVIDEILDTASQKGTGRWTSEAAFEFGYPTTIINASVMQRSLSSYLDTRTKLNKEYIVKNIPYSNELPSDSFKFALFVSILLSYVQGIELIKLVSSENNWNIPIVNVLQTWRKGCIIEADMLDNFNDIDKNESNHILLLSNIKTIINNSVPYLKEICTLSIYHNIPIPGLAAALNYFNSYTTGLLPSNLIQAQRDFFGSHGYQKVNSDTTSLSHTIWEDF